MRCVDGVQKQWNRLSTASRYYISDYELSPSWSPVRIIPPTWPIALALGSSTGSRDSQVTHRIMDATQPPEETQPQAAAGGAERQRL